MTHFFPDLKKYLKSTNFTPDEEVKEVLKSWIKKRQIIYFSDGMKKIVTRWKICLSLNGNYIEKSRCLFVSEEMYFHILFLITSFHSKNIYDYALLINRPSYIRISKYDTSRVRRKSRSVVFPPSVTAL